MPTVVIGSMRTSQPLISERPFRLGRPVPDVTDREDAGGRSAGRCGHYCSTPWRIKVRVPEPPHAVSKSRRR